MDPCCYEPSCAHHQQYQFAPDALAGPPPVLCIQVLYRRRAPKRAEFCSWACLSQWAYRQAIDNGEEPPATHPAEVVAHDRAIGATLHLFHHPGCQCSQCQANGPAA